MAQHDEAGDFWINSGQSGGEGTIERRALGIMEFVDENTVVVRAWRYHRLPMTIKGKLITTMTPVELVAATEQGWSVLPTLHPDRKIRGKVSEEADPGYEEEFSLGILYYLLQDPSLYSDSYRLRRVY